MENYVGKICPHCKKELTEDDEIAVCSKCGLPQHKACWEENGGCATYGCIGKIMGEKNEDEVSEEDDGYTFDDLVYCTNCGEECLKSHAFCSKCGSPVGENAKRVPKTVKTVQTESADKPEAVTVVSNPAYKPESTIVDEEHKTSETLYKPSEESDARDFVDEMLEYVGSNQVYYNRQFRSMYGTQKKASWNWSAFFCTAYWAIYRGMPGWAFLGIIASVISLAVPFVGWILSFMFGIFGNYFYMKSVEKKAREGEDLHGDDKYDYISRVGGTHGGAVVGVMVLIFIIWIIIFAVAMSNSGMHSRSYYPYY